MISAAEQLFHQDELLVAGTRDQQQAGIENDAVAYNHNLDQVIAASEEGGRVLKSLGGGVALNNAVTELASAC